LVSGSVCVCVCVGVEAVMTLGCVFVLMLADRAKPGTCANNLQDSSEGENKHAHRHTHTHTVRVSFLLNTWCVIWIHELTEGGKMLKKVYESENDGESGSDAGEDEKRIVERGV